MPFPLLTTTAATAWSGKNSVLGVIWTGQVQGAVISAINMRTIDLCKTIFTKISKFYKGKLVQEFYITHYFIL
jgi:hypothetical protein